MNSTLMRILAALLAFGALVAAWVGYQMSTEAPPPRETAVEAPKQTAVAAAKPIPAGHIVAAEDLKTIEVAQRDPRGFAATDLLIGKVTAKAIADGAQLLSSDFPVLGPVAQSLLPGERGVAVKVDEVVGVGGFVKPGDHVDVLLHLRAEEETGKVTSAQLVLRNVRVLAFGDAITVDSDKAAQPAAQRPKADGAANDAKDDSQTKKDEAKKDETKRAKESRSAILAVPEKDATRLMLAATSGSLRLALRGAEPPAEVKQGEDETRFVKLAELSRADEKGVAKGESGKGKLANAKKAVGAVGQGDRVIVQRGDKVEVVTVGGK